MTFNSYLFIFTFLPITILAYSISIRRFSTYISKAIILIASLIFYLYAGIRSFLVILLCVIINHLLCSLIQRYSNYKKIYTIIAVVLNIAVLFIYKYVPFLQESIFKALGKETSSISLLVPLGLSFFIFQQIAYIVSLSKEEYTHSLFDYLIFTFYFPKLIMGPLMEPSDFLIQLNDNKRHKFSWDNIATGIKLFSFGLFKKLMIADVFARAVNWGFSNFEIVTSFDWILISVFYTMQIYFDFSGFIDMATGMSSMFNITLPINFDSPYRATSIREFWKRWHISLTKFFTKYVYIPLGGNRLGQVRTITNIMLIFLLSGLWHGANWTFLVWGFGHGLFMIFDRVFEKYLEKVFIPIRWIATMMIVNILWLLFRAESIAQWVSCIRMMVLMQNTHISAELCESFVLPEASFISRLLHIEVLSDYIMGFWMWIYLFSAILLCALFNNNYRSRKSFSAVSLVFSILAFTWGVISIIGESTFIYTGF